MTNAHNSMAFHRGIQEGRSGFFHVDSVGKTDHSQQCWNLGSSMANAGLSMSCSSESRACEHSCPPLFIHIFILASQMYFELLLGPGSMPGSVLDAGERMMNEISVVPTLVKLTSRGRQETLHMGRLFRSARCCGPLI